MKKIANPFYNKRPVATVENFYGREDLIEDIYFSFINLDPPDFLSLVGSRGIGKSSIINMVVAPEIRNLFLKGDKTLLVRINFEDEELSNSLGFYKFIFKSINYEIQNDMFSSRDEKEHFQASYDRIYGEKEVEIVKDKLKDILRWLKRSEYKTVLIMDNFEKAFRETELTKADFSFLRSGADANQFRIGYIFATTNNLESISRDIIASGLKNVFKKRKMLPFNDEQMSLYINNPFRENGIELEIHYVDWIKKASGGVPSILRTACEIIFDSKMKNKNYSGYEEFLIELADECRPLFNSIWKSMDKDVKRVCTEIAAGKKVDESFHIRSGMDNDILFEKAGNHFIFLSDAFRQYVLESEESYEVIHIGDRVESSNSEINPVMAADNVNINKFNWDIDNIKEIFNTGFQIFGRAVGQVLSIQHEDIIAKLEELPVKTAVGTAEFVIDEVTGKLDKGIETLSAEIEGRFAGFEKQFEAVRVSLDNKGDGAERVIDYANEVRAEFMSNIQNKDVDSIDTIKESQLRKEWEKLNDGSREFIILGEMLNKMFNVAKIDKNFISICYCCVLENEINEHLVDVLRKEHPDMQVDISGKKYILKNYEKGLALGQVYYMLNDKSNLYYSNILLRMRSRRIDHEKLLKILKELTEIRNDAAHSNRKIVQDDIDKLRKHILGIGKEQSILKSIFDFD